MTAKRKTTTRAKAKAKTKPKPKAKAKPKRKTASKGGKAPGRKRARAAASGVPRRVRVLIATMALVLVVGIAAVKFFDSTRGRVLMLDFGFTDYYAQVQDELNDGLLAVVADRGLEPGLDERIKAQTVGGRRFLYREWRVTCDESQRFIDVNVAVTRSVKSMGGVVRSGIEVDQGRGKSPRLEFDIGSHTYTTHRVTFVRADAAGGEAGAVPEPVAVIKDTRPKLALVIDDFGYTRRGLVEKFFKLDLPLTCAIIPELPNTEYSIARVREANKQPILHVPMEAEAFDSDVQVVGTQMSDDEIVSLLDRYLSQNPGVVGVNNHLGSLATQDNRVMEQVIAIIKRYNLFYLDSFTSPRSVAYNTAKMFGVPTARNDLFLDDDTEDDRVVEERLWELVEIARDKGFAIGIGHPKQWTYDAIARNVKSLKEAGVELVFLSELVENE